MDFDMKIDDKTKEWFKIVETYWSNTPPPNTTEEFLQQIDKLQKLLNELDKKYDKLKEKTK